MAKKVPRHGGARKGAGRKPVNAEGRTVPLAATVPETLVVALETIAKDEGWSKSRVVTEAIRAYVARKKR